MTPTETAVLAFEARRFHHAGSKETAVHCELGLSMTRYHQVLNGLLDSPEAYLAEPMLVKRLRRLRTERRARRIG